MTTPLVKPIRPEFSSGPCAKRPGWSLKNLANATLGRSHRHIVAKKKLEKAKEKGKSDKEMKELITELEKKEDFLPPPQ